MSLKELKCLDCGALIDNEQESCSHCGANLDEKKVDSSDLNAINTDNLNTSDDAVISSSRVKSYKRASTRDITVSAMLVALSFIMPYFMPTVHIPFFTATLFSHVPIMLAMFVSPFAALATVIGTALAFAIKVPDPTVAVRASTHIVFAIVGAVLINRKIWVKGYKIAFLAVVLAIIHAVMEILAVVIMANILIKTDTLTTNYLFSVVGLTTIAHGLVDFGVAFVVFGAAVKARLLAPKFSYHINKSKTRTNSNN